MTDIPSSDPTDQAIVWQMKFVEAPEDVVLLAGHRAWLAASPRNERAWRKAERVRNLARLTIRKGNRGILWPPREAVVASIQVSCIADRRSATRWLRWTSSATVAALTIAFLCGPALYDRLRADYVTGVGGVRQITLPDGSEITLGAETAITVNDHDGARQVTLLKGEALFHVTHDDARPFTVRAGTATMRDVGTVFDVRKNGARLTLAVREGIVGLLAPHSGVNTEVRVDAGRQIEVTENSATVARSAIEPDTVGSWRSGLLAVDGIDVSDLVGILKRYYPGYVILRGTPPEAIRVGGVYDLRHSAEGLRMLASAQGGSVSEYGNHLIIVTFASAPSELIERR